MIQEYTIVTSSTLKKAFARLLSYILRSLEEFVAKKRCSNADIETVDADFIDFATSSNAHFVVRLAQKARS
jgi:hypothetical protein